MAIILSCRCGQTMQANDEFAGQQVRCPACSTVLLVPGRAPATPPVQAVSVEPPDYRPPQRGGDAYRPRPRRPSQYEDEGELSHQFQTFPTPVVILLHFVTFGIFTHIWLNLMHGKMPQLRHDDPSAGKGIGFLFIPFYNLYWVFFTYHRLCERITEQRRLAGLPGGPPTGLAVAMCVVLIIPYVGLISLVTLMPIFAGIVQANVNELALATQRD